MGVSKRGHCWKSLFTWRYWFYCSNHVTNCVISFRSQAQKQCAWFYFHFCFCCYGFWLLSSSSMTIISEGNAPFTLWFVYVRAEIVKFFLMSSKCSWNADFVENIKEFADMVQVRFARWNPNWEVWVLAQVAYQSLFPPTSITVWGNTSPLLWTLKRGGGGCTWLKGRRVPWLGAKSSQLLRSNVVSSLRCYSVVDEQIIQENVKANKYPNRGGVRNGGTLPLSKQNGGLDLDTSTIGSVESTAVSANATPRTRRRRKKKMPCARQHYQFDYLDEGILLEDKPLSYSTDHPYSYSFVTVDTSPVCTCNHNGFLEAGFDRLPQRDLYTSFTPAFGTPNRSYPSRYSGRPSWSLPESFVWSNTLVSGRVLVSFWLFSLLGRLWVFPPSPLDPLRDWLATILAVRGP